MTFLMSDAQKAAHAASSASRSSASFIKCPSCGFHNRPGPAECEKCGQPIKGSPIQRPINSNRTSGGTGFLIVLGGLAILVGIATSSPATGGVSAIAVGCFFAILARIAQAGRQHRDLLDRLTPPNARE
jgi:hypothetical protein